MKKSTRLTKIFKKATLCLLLTSSFPLPQNLSALTKKEVIKTKGATKKYIFRIFITLISASVSIGGVYFFFCWKGNLGYTMVNDEKKILWQVVGISSLVSIIIFQLFIWISNHLFLSKESIEPTQEKGLFGQFAKKSKELFTR